MGGEAYVGAEFEKCQLRGPSVNAVANHSSYRDAPIGIHVPSPCSDPREPLCDPQRAGRHDDRLLTVRSGEES
jgi:hypothetical protein